MDIINDSKHIGLMVIVTCLLISTILNIKTIVIIIAFLLCIIILILIKPNVYPVRLIYAQIIYNSIIKFAISCFNIPNSANYLTDIFTLLIVIEALIELRTKKIKSSICLSALVVVAFFLVTIIGFVINGQTIFLYIWGFRNNFRFYGFFFGCVVLLKKKDIDVMLKTILFVAMINTVVATVQYFLFGIRQDNLGGIFGTNQGVNGYVNIFMCVVCIIALVKFLSSKISNLLLIATIFSSIYIAALSELKMFFVELIIIIVCLVILSKPSKKTILVVLACILSVYLGVQLLYKIFPYFKDFFTIERIMHSGNTYSTATDLGRFTATKTITSMFLSQDKLKYLFGLGMGSAETSQISMFNSKFFNEYGLTLHYTWFSSAFMLVENGWLGLTCYLSFFISIFYGSFKIKKGGTETFTYCIMTQIFAVLCCVIVFYNGSLRTEAGYYAYFMLSLPFAINSKDIETDC